MPENTDPIAAFTARCLEAPSEEEFPWKELIKLGKLAGYGASIRLKPTMKGMEGEVLFYVETIVRLALSDAVDSPTVTEWNGRVSINSRIYSQMLISQDCVWLPLFLALACRKR